MCPDLPSSSEFQVIPGFSSLPVASIQVEMLQLDLDSGIFSSTQVLERPEAIKSSMYEGGLLTRKVLLGNYDSPEYLPLDLIQLSAYHDLFLLPFSILKDNSSFIVWFLDRNLDYIDQHLVEAEDVSILYRLVNSFPKIPSWLSTFDVSTQNCHMNSLGVVRERSLQSMTRRINQGSDFSDPEASPQISSFFAALINQLMPTNLMQTLLTQLSDEPESLPHCNIPELLEIWQYSCEQTDLPDGLSEWSDAISREHRYVLLKELHLLQNGTDLVFNPFLGRHQIGDKATFLPRINESGYPTSVNKAVLFHQGDIDLVEFRGPGISMMVTGYQIGSNRVIARCDSACASWSPSDYGRFASDAAPYLHRASKRSPSKDTCIQVLNMTLSLNLGHTLWNDISGYYLIKDLIKAFPDCDFKVAIHSYQVNQSVQSYNEFFHPFILNTLPDLDVHVVSNFEAIGDFVRPMVLKSMRIPFSISDAMRKHYSSDFKSTDQIRILVNLRAHNKSLLNTPECLDYWLSLPEVRPLFHRLEFCLEFQELARPMCNDVVDVLIKHGIAHNQLIDCNLDRLCQEISHSDVVIAPVGSALVLPTWIWNHECVAHGDPIHMMQILFWPAVVPFFTDQSERIHAITDEAIHAESTEIYSNYRLQPDVFSAQLQAALARKLSL